MLLLFIKQISMADQSPECQSPARQFRVFERGPVGEAPGAPLRAVAKRTAMPRMEMLSLEKEVVSSSKMEMRGWQT